MAQINDQGVTFGEWLLGQCSRDDARGDFASAAKANPKFPRRGSPADVRKRELGIGLCKIGRAHV